MPLDTNQIYVISSATADPETVTLRPKDPTSTRKEPIVTEKTNSQPKWRLYETSSGSNVYIVALADNDSRRLQVENNRLWLVTTNEGSKFSIESAGEASGDHVYRMHVPNQNSVIRAEGNLEQVSIDEEDGSKNELWYFNEWHHA